MWSRMPTGLGHGRAACAPEVNARAPSLMWLDGSGFLGSVHETWPVRAAKPTPTHAFVQAYLDPRPFRLLPALLTMPVRPALPIRKSGRLNLCGLGSLLARERAPRTATCRQS